MSQEPPPPQYHSSEQILDGISLAYSTLNNPRGLECLWNCPYRQTFSELLCPYQDGKFLIYSPYTLWMPALIKKEQVLRKDFEDSGLDYDAAPARITRMFLRTSALKVQAHRQQFSPNVVKTCPSGPRKSNRNKQKDEEAPRAEQQKLENEINQLFKRRFKIIDEQNELAESRTFSSNMATLD